MSSSVRSALAISFLEKYSGLALNIISTIALARLLTPRDIGIYSVCAAVANLAAMLRNFGMANYVIQEKELTEARLRSALGVMAITASSIAILLALSSRFVSDFYGEPGIESVLYVLSANFIVIPFNAIVLNLLRREMKFTTILRVSLAGAVAHTVTSISLAWLGFGFMCMAWAAFANVSATAVAAVALRPRQYRLTPSLTAWRDVISFGAYSTGAQLITEAAQRMPDLIIGRMLGLAGVGLFSRANGLVELFSQTVTTAAIPVALSAFAVKHRDGEPLAPGYLYAVSLMTAVAWPSLMFLGMMAYPIIHILFGEQWDRAVPLAHYLCAGGFIAALGGLHLSVFQATGAVRKNLAVQAMLAPLQLILLLIAALHSLEAVAATAMVMAALRVALSQVYVNGIVGVSARDIAAAVWKSAVATACAAVTPGAVLYGMPMDEGTLWRPLLTAAAGCAAGWLAAVLALNHPIRGELGLLAAKGRQAILRQA